MPFRAKSSTAAKCASLHCKLGSERRTSPKAQRTFSKLEIEPNIFHPYIIYMKILRSGLSREYLVLQI